MADESYSLSEVADSLGISKEDVVRRVHHGEFPGRFLTSELEMRVPARDVRRALEKMPSSRPRGGSSEALVSSAGMNLEAWSRERELLEGVILDREARLEALVSDGFEALHRKLDELSRRMDALEWDGGLEPSSGRELDELLDEVRALERMAGLDGTPD